MPRLVRLVFVPVLTALVAATTLTAGPAAAVTPPSGLAADVTAIRDALRSNSPTLTSVKSAARSRAVTHGLRLRSSGSEVVLWDPRKPSVRAVFTVAGSRVDVRYRSASVTSNDRRELELYKALDATAAVVKAKSTVVFAKTDANPYAPTIPNGSTIARRDAAGNLSIVTGDRVNVVVDGVHTRSNPRTWSVDERAAISGAGLDPDAQLLRRSATPAVVGEVRSAYTAFTTRAMNNMIAQAFDVAPKVSVSKTKSSTIYRVRSKVSSTATPKATGDITTSFVVRKGRITLAMLTPDAKAAKHGSAVRISVNTSTGKVRAVSGSVIDADQVAALPAIQIATARREAPRELESFLRTVLVAGDAAAVNAALSRYAATPSTAAVASRLAAYGIAVEWRNPVYVMCGRLDLVAGIVIAETSCQAAGYSKS